MYRGRLQRDLSLWVGKGFIQPEQASAIMAEYDERPTSFSLGRVLSILAALLVAVAILLLVAANWELIPRLVRLGVLAVLIWAFYIGGAFSMARGQTALASGLLLLGTMSFGGAMSLVGQMYHLSGDELEMILVWFVLACTAAVAFRSGSQVVLAGFLSWAYFGIFLEQNDTHWIGWSPWAPPIMAAIVLLIVRYVGSGRARHLTYLLLIAWLTWIYSLSQQLPMAVLFAGCGMLAFLATCVPGSPFLRLVRQAGAAPSFYTYLVAVIGFFLLHLEVENGPRFIALGVVTLASSVVAIALCGRDNGAVRYLAYAVFATEILYLASQTIGSIIGTSGFFLVSGFLVAAVAWLVVRMERRMAGRGREVCS